VPVGVSRNRAEEAIERINRTQNPQKPTSIIRQQAEQRDDLPAALKRWRSAGKSKIIAAVFLGMLLFGGASGAMTNAYSQDTISVQSTQKVTVDSQLSREERNILKEDRDKFDILAPQDQDSLKNKDWKKTDSKRLLEAWLPPQGSSFLKYVKTKLIESFDFVHNRIEPRYSKGETNSEIGIQNLIKSGIFDKHTAVMLDSGGAHSVAMAIELMKAGYQPVVMFNNIPHSQGTNPSQQELATLLYFAEEAMQLKGKFTKASSPVFILDAHRTDMVQPGQVNNTYSYSRKDFPTAEKLKELGINTVIYVNEGDVNGEIRPDFQSPDRLMEDLKPIFEEWEKEGNIKVKYTGVAPWKAGPGIISTGEVLEEIVPVAPARVAKDVNEYNKSNASEILEELTSDEKTSQGIMPRLGLNEAIKWDKKRPFGLYVVGNYDKNRPTALFVHGAGTPGDFEIFLKQYNGKYNLAVFWHDYLKGFDNTELFRDECRKFIQAFKPGQLTIIAHSFGSNILAKAVIDLKESEKDMFKDAAIVLLSPTIFGSGKARGASNGFPQFFMKLGAKIPGISDYSRVAAIQDPEGSAIKFLFENLGTFRDRVGLIQIIYMNKDKHLDHLLEPEFAAMYEELYDKAKSIFLIAKKDGHTEILSEKEVIDAAEEAVNRPKADHSNGRKTIDHKSILPASEMRHSL